MTRWARGSVVAAAMLVVAACGVDDDNDGTAAADVLQDAVAVVDAVADVGDVPLAETSRPDGVAVDAEETLELDAQQPQTLPIGSLSAIPNPANSLSRYIEWRTSSPASTVVSVACDGEDTIEYEDFTLEETHSVFVWGFAPGMECEVAARSHAGTTTWEGQVTFTADEPHLTLPELEIDVAADDRVQPGWTLVNLNNHFDSQPLRVALVDTEGRYRWYAQSTNGIAGVDNELRVVRPDEAGRSSEFGVLVGGNRTRLDPFIVSWEGSTLWTGDFYMHHDIRWLNGGAEVAYLVDEGDCGTGFNAGGYDVRDRITDEVTESWRICEHYLPETLRNDWSHLNSLVFRDDTVLMSSREQDALFLTQRSTGEVLWALGVGDDFTLPEEAVFHRQHAAMWTGEDSILLFDNGLAGTRDFSRGLELRLDVMSGEVEVVWQYVPEGELFTPIWGDADRLANGNTLLTFGFRTEDESARTTVVEVDGETPVWRMRLQPKWGIYRADRTTLQGVQVQRALR